MQSVFANGPCLVYAWCDTLTTPAWSGSLGLGETGAGFTDPDNAAQSLVVAVDANGVVSLTINAEALPSVASGRLFVVEVVPPAGATDAQISNVTMPDATYTASPSFTNPLSFTDGTGPGPCTPNPFVVSNNGTDPFGAQVRKS